MTIPPGGSLKFEFKAEPQNGEPPSQPEGLPPELQGLNWIPLKITVRCHKCSREIESKDLNNPASGWFRLSVREGDTYLQTQLCPRHAPIFSFRRWAWRYQWRVGGLISRCLNPGFRFSFCERCGTSWAYVSAHCTWYSENVGAGPLCDKCWVETTPFERLPFYESLGKKWGSEQFNEVWPALRQAVLEGK